MVNCTCGNQNKGRRHASYSVDETPVRDTEKVEFPSEPPPCPDDTWDLQYCKWSGWTWVKKNDITRQSMASSTHTESSKHVKKKKGCFSFKQKKAKPLKANKTSSMTQMPSPPAPVLKKVETPKPSRHEFEECCCCDMDSYCCCGQCCPCCQGCCCCAGEDDKSCRKKCIETQTICQVKEQATKTSEMQIPKRRVCCRRRRRCRCNRPCCASTCSCMRNTCCTCCSCKRINGDNSADNKKVLPTNIPKDTEQLINYCLQGNIRKPDAVDFLNYNSSNFTTLHKSLDILLRNNINIMGLLTDTKEWKFKSPDSRVSSDHTIKSLTSDLKKSADPEHGNLLTAVCDAIFSSHKFENSRLNHEPRETFNSYSLFSSNRLLDKLLNDVHFPPEDNKEIGVQVNKRSHQRDEICCQHKKSYTRLSKNKSRILLAPRFPKRVEALRRNVDLLRFGYDSSARKRSNEKRFSDARNKHERHTTTLFKTGNDNSSSRKISFDRASTKSGNDAKPGTSLKLDHIETLLNSIEYINCSSNICGARNSSDREKSESTLHGRQSTQVLESTSPPLTNSEILLDHKDVH